MPDLCTVAKRKAERALPVVHNGSVQFVLTHVAMLTAKKRLPLSRHCAIGHCMQSVVGALCRHISRTVLAVMGREGGAVCLCVCVCAH